MCVYMCVCVCYCLIVLIVFCVFFAFLSSWKIFQVPESQLSETSSGSVNATDSHEVERHCLIYYA